MLIPRYYFTNDFNRCQNILFHCLHHSEHYVKSEYLWKPGEPLTQCFYIVKGIARAAVEHEDGYEKIQSFHTKGTVYPGSAHKNVFKIENAITLQALTDMDVWTFEREDYRDMVLNSRELTACVLDWYASYINLLLYETAHQEYNRSFSKLCNLLFLFANQSEDENHRSVHLSQDDVADILTINRGIVSRNLARLRADGIIITHRNWIEITDFSRLESLCSSETRPE